MDGAVAGVKVGPWLPGAHTGDWYIGYNGDLGPPSVRASNGVGSVYGEVESTVE